MKNRTWAEIDTDALAHNFKEIRRVTSPSAKILAVVKADAYGHGVVEVTKTLIENGADCLAVACADEGKQLRRAGIELPILILGASSDVDCEDLVKYSLMPAVFSLDFAGELSRTAQRLNKKVKIHIKLDTGMSRIGFVAGINDDLLADSILEIAKLPFIEIDGIFSHFSTSDETDRSYTQLQFKRFMNVCGILEKKGLHIPTRHIANSAAIMMYPETHLDMVRAGVILYGLYPSEEVDRSRIDLRPVMTVKSKITMVKTLEKNRGVSYGKTYITDHPTRIATVPIGYADGYTRLLSGSAKMVAKNKPVPVIGRICMDQCMIDVTNVNTINTGDEVIVFGADVVTADDLAGWIGSINYEIVCMISMRIPRIYLKNGKAVKSLNYLNKI
jgi:alanine racemase